MDLNTPPGFSSVNQQAANHAGVSHRIDYPADTL
jgi:hypothetical protein